MYRLIGAAVVLVLASVLVVSRIGAPPVAHAEDPSAQILAGLKTAAAAGNERARSALADLDSFVLKNHLDAAALNSREVDQSARTGKVTLSARGTTPFRIDVFATADLSSDKALSAYAIERRAAALALVDGSSRHRGHLAFNDFVTVDRLCDLRDAAKATISDAEVDVWLDGNWVTRVGYGPDQPAFWSRGCSLVTDGIRAVLASAHSDEPLGQRANEVRLTVYGATLEADSGGIGVLLAAPDVLLFDPETDLISPWAGAASHVRLAASVDTFGALVEAKVRAGEIAYPFVSSGLPSKDGQP